MSEEEEKFWNHLVDTGREIREPLLMAREVKRAENRMKLEETRDFKCRGMECRDGGRSARGSKANSVKDVPESVKRFIVLRASGLTFRQASADSGAAWYQVVMAKDGNEDVRCAMAAMEDNSRQLMRIKASSLVEQSQDEGARVSMPQVNLSMKILTSLDRDHFGDMPKNQVAEEVQKQLGGGGFVINLIGDAAKAAEAVPVKKPGKALVYTDV